MVRCADGSLYTGIAKDVARRCHKHNDGTASRYTRSRLPVELIYQEAHPGQSPALKREAAIKAMDRRGKLMMAKQSKTPASCRGVTRMHCYDDLCRITGHRHDPCLLDTFIAAVRYMDGAPKRPCWKYTAERKREMAARTVAGR